MALRKLNLLEWLLVSGSLLILVPNSLWAQNQITGSIEGRVELEDGKPAPNAKILIKDEYRNVEVTVFSDAEGRYFRPLLQPGYYTLTCELEGYEISSERHVKINVASAGKLGVPPFRLTKVMATPTPPLSQPLTVLSENVESDAVRLANLNNATRGGNFDERQLLALPLAGIRSFDSFALLLPGVAPAPRAIGRTVGPGIGAGVGTSGQFSVNGLRSRANNFTVDGSDNNDEEIGVRRQGFTSLVPQSIESVQDFQVSTLLPTPQYGRNMAAQVNAVSRSGTNSVHGSLYGFLTNQRLKSREFEDSEKAPYTRAQYGLAIGGPLKSGNTFFFASAEHQDVNASKQSHFATPTIAERGLFGRGGTDLNINGVSKPTTARGDAFFALFPDPNNPSGPYGPNTFSQILPAGADGVIFSGKIDHDFGSGHAFAGRYNFTDDDTVLPVTGEALYSSLRPLTRTQNISLFLNSAGSSNLSNQVRFSFGRTALQFQEVRNPLLIPGDRTPNEPFLLNRPLGNSTTEKSGTGPIGQVIVSGYSPLGVDVFNFPQRRANNTFQYADTVLYNRSKHRITAGFDGRRNESNSFLNRNSRPLAVFQGAPDLSDSQLSNNQPEDLRGLYLGRDFVAAGAATGFFQTLAVVPDTTLGLRYWQSNFFLADQIRLHPNFALTLGLRYELNTVPVEVHNRLESALGSDQVKAFEAQEESLYGVSGLKQFLNGRSEMFSEDRDNFAPHLAFAWDLFGNGRTSLRGGYGIYYDQIPGAVISQSRSVYPNFVTINCPGTRNFQGVFQSILSYTNPGGPLPLPNTLFQINPASPLGKNSVGFINNISSGKSSNYVAGTGFVFPAANLETPYAQHWGLTLEREVKRDLLFSFAYAGTRGLHLLRLSTPNYGTNSIPVVNSIAPNTDPLRVFDGFQWAPKKGRIYPLLGPYTSIASDANSIYHSLQIQANKRFAKGVQFTTAYTWAHAIDEVSDIFDLDGARTLPQNSFNRRGERGAANFDIRHRFVYSLLWDLPLAQSSKALGGWQVATIGRFDTGQPYTILAGFDTNLDGNLTDRLASTSGISAIDNGSTLLQLSSNPRSLLAASGQDGSVGRNTFRAPGIASVDLALNKTFKFTERQGLQFRAEFFNLFNRTHYSTPVHQLFFPGFGSSVDSLVPARIIQFALKYNF